MSCSSIKAPAGHSSLDLPLANAALRHPRPRCSISTAQQDRPFRHGKGQAAPGVSFPEDPIQAGSGVPLDRETHGDSSTRSNHPINKTMATAAASEGVGGGASLNEGGGGGVSHRSEDKGQDDDVISMLKRTLQETEKRAQQAEQSRSDEEALRRREEARARALEERVADLEKKLLKQAENGSSNNSGSVS